MEAVQILLPEDRRKAFEERLLADEDSRMLIGNCLTLPDSQDKDPLDVVAVFYRGKGRVVVTGIDPDHAAGFEGLIRRYLHFFLVKVHGGHDDALAKLRVRYNRAKVRMHCFHSHFTHWTHSLPSFSLSLSHRHMNRASSRTRTGTRSTCW